MTAQETAPHPEHSHGNPRLELGFAITAGLTYAAGMLSEYAFSLPLMGLPLVFFVATYFFGGFFTVSGAVSSTHKGKFDVDFLMVVAALGAALIGKWAEGAVLLFLFSLGHALEEYAMGRASRSIEALAELSPRTAMVRRGAANPTEIAIEELVVGDVMVVRPHSRIPADGLVIVGHSAVDQSAMTGESIPVEKEPDCTIFAGTVNGSRLLEATVTATAADSTLSRVVELVRNADNAKSPTELFITKFQRWYVPVVIVGVIATQLVAQFVCGQPFGDAFYLAMTILVAASPCALAIATPSAILAGIARAARIGVLFKGGAPLETLGQVKAIAFDKTGTLTWGLPVVASMTTFAPGQGILLPTMLAVESLSDHPLATAIVSDLSAKVPAKDRLQATDLTAIIGQGVSASINGELVQVGNLRLFADIQVPADVLAAAQVAEGDGQTLMIVRRAGKFLGVVGVMDIPRAESAHVIDALRAADVETLVMLSGDSQSVADAVGRRVGIDQALGGLLPQDKADHVKALAAQNAPVAMVGDGVNDAPAMAGAHIGIAMGAAGSTVALETCDIALMSDDLGRVPFAIRLSRATHRIIKQNLIASLAIVVLLIAATFLGLGIGPVVLIHEGSTLIVVLNALRLLGFQQGREHEGIEHEEAPRHLRVSR